MVLNSQRKNTYKEYVDKFKAKKTTDDTFTPDLIYNTILDYVTNKYGVDKDKVVRPFWPGGDYENFDYSDGEVVIDNPPFSLMSQIVHFYITNNIRFFLFAPGLTLLNVDKNDFNRFCHVVTDSVIEYENGAKVRTCFVTNLDDNALVVDTKLSDLIKEANQQANPKRQVPVYKYPDNVLRMTDFFHVSKLGKSLSIPQNQALWFEKTESQKKAKTKIFGSGMLVTDKIADLVGKYRRQPSRPNREWTLGPNDKALLKRLNEQAEVNE